METFFVTFLALSLRVLGVFGHGAMYYPNPWHTSKGCTIDESPHDCWFDMKVHDGWMDDCTVGSNGCSNTAGRFAWFTNYTTVEEETLPEEMYSSGRHESYPGLHPWASPGSAWVYGEGCGVNGGNPEGCDYEDQVIGRCCGDSIGWGCGGYVGGRPAQDFYKEGFFGEPTTTTWVAGEPAEVAWYSNAHHRGGYAYRLCKVNNGEVWKVTEECFQNGHLNFYGNTSWIYRRPKWGEKFSQDGWKEYELVTTREGTTPEGSEWASLVILPKNRDDDSWAIKDLVEVPESLEPGEYVLSFRWDCQRTPQIWNACANIKVENWNVVG